ncbi:unnamed protein product [Protopolystoma xenopodis]|uniref:Uncharacterized protein n=1 Tax=Protopolystoma xenopodis TaxID=117903 RepID=A0A3S4ZWM5_9PLAT|nr:unnamed protein product [Protopolystoma xenopodis]
MIVKAGFRNTATPQKRHRLNSSATGTSTLFAFARDRATPSLDSLQVAMAGCQISAPGGSNNDEEPTAAFAVS